MQEISFCFPILSVKQFTLIFKFIEKLGFMLSTLEFKVYFLWPSKIIKEVFRFWFHQSFNDRVVGFCHLETSQQNNNTNG